MVLCAVATLSNSRSRTQCGLHGDCKTFIENGYDACSPFYQRGLTLIPTRISNHIHYKMWHEITYPFLNFNGGTMLVKGGRGG